MKKVTAWFGGGILVLTCATAAAAHSPAPAPPTAMSPSAQAFVKGALAGGMAEVELGKLAQEKASSDEVKKFGQRMVDDHSKAGDELKAIAASKQVEVPTDLPAKEKALRDRLSRMSGPAFDRAYMQSMVADHVEDVKMFTREAHAANDPDVKAFAAKTLPTLQDHLAMARRTNTSIRRSK